jgi:ABC-2 type transport system ATP-binding protein
MTDISLNISGVSAGYGALPVIHDISLSVARGETFGLVGLNGAGKTTLLKTILGLRDALSGNIGVEGSEAGTASAKERLAFLPERFEPAWFLNAYEFIRFTLSLYGRKIATAEIDILADSLGLKREYLKKRAQTYSKGMRQKLGLMSVFLSGCPLLILDEPMSGLDPLARSQVKTLMGRAKKEGRTVFFSSHILSDMQELCDRVAIIHAGRIAFTGKPSDLLVGTGQESLERAFLHLIEVDKA